MAFDAYLKIDGITTSGLNGIELESFSWGASNSGTPATGQEAGQTSFTDFSFSAMLGQQSPQLFAKCVDGEHLDSATLTINGAPSQIMLKFSEVLVSSYKVAEHSLQKIEDQVTSKMFYSESPKESVTLSFSKIEFNFGATVGAGGSSPAS